jgi:hypothetical protein
MVVLPQRKSLATFMAVLPECCSNHPSSPDRAFCAIWMTHFVWAEEEENWVARTSRAMTE